MRWEGREVRLEPHYKVNPASFELEPKTILANEHGRRMTKYAVGLVEHQIFASLADSPVGYRELVEQLRRQQCPDERQAAVDVDVAARLVTERDRAREGLRIAEALHQRPRGHLDRGISVADEQEGDVGDGE